MKIIAADLFCGAGGETTGLLAACADLHKDVELLAINHWEVAIQTHEKNHPNVKHLCENIQSVDPIKVIPGRRLNLLWASPECTHHSNARGGRPCSDQSRASAWLILKWLQELYVDRVIIENVPEFEAWGPLTLDGKPMQSKRGETFRAFCNALKSLGYKVDYRLLCAADYGDPTTRVRFFLQAVRGQNKIKWPEVTHTRSSDMFAQKRWIPAKDIIDWSIPGKSIFDRKKPLADNTLKRIEAGIKKYWGEMAEPFLVILRGTGTARSLNSPLPTVTTSGAHFGLVEPFVFATGQTSAVDRSRSIHDPLSTVVTKAEHCLIEPFITRFNGGDNRNHGINEPLPVIDCSNRYGLIEPLIVDMTRTSQNHESRIYSSDQPLRTITTHNNIAVMSPFILKYYGSGASIQGVDVPLDTITCKDRFALINGSLHTLDIRFRMLLPHELAAAQGFPRNYVFSGNRCDQVRQIGNAVPCNMARAICKAVLAA